VITTATADALEALGIKIWNPATFSGLKSADADIDTQLVALIEEPMKVIDGRTLAQGFRYTLNVTNALQLRAKHWYSIITELAPNMVAPCSASFELLASPNPNSAVDYAYSYGNTLGLATCAGICLTWAKAIRMFLKGQYPYGSV
jgi:hypothetical protein